MGFGEKEGKKSPIKQFPLRSAGQSLRERGFDLIIDSMLPIVMAAFMLGLCLTEWARYFFRPPPAPLPMTFLFIFFACYAAWRYRRMWQELGRLRLGYSGEVYVGQLLEGLRKNGYEVFHDVVDGNHNIDHVLVGPGGVFTIDTKTVSKSGGREEVVYDGEHVTIAGQSPDRDPIIQALACARSLTQILAGTESPEWKVQPVVIYPNWYVRLKGTKPAVWVFNESYFTKMLPDLTAKLDEGTVRRLSERLATFVKHKAEVEAAKG